ncbi:hypothetical protein [Sinorhizobium meliloti]|uniref:hypothetical protein n=1 Tax=Rhizobium meliloti TaxID=382 RepID=UPI000FDACEDE|nr:hypothetical protein [Sinorhizobium meliloti]RVK29528.1 hypothetical protein CN163_28475 [Sinorhizobium meliloti]
MADKADSLTILTEKNGRRLAKHHVYQNPSGGWVTQSYPANPFLFSYEQHRVQSLGDLAHVLNEAAADRSHVVIRAKPNALAAKSVAETGYTRRNKVCFDAVSRRWVCIDVDDVTAPGFDIRKDPAAAVAWLIETHFPPEFQNTRIIWQLSSSAGLKDPERVKVHLWCWLSRPLGFEELKAWRMQGDFPADKAMFNDVQIHYIANPSFEGAPDPCSQRWGILEGEHDEIQVPEIDMEKARARAAERGESLTGMVSGKDVAAILSKMGDGEGGHGFHGVILSAQMKWARTTPPAFHDRQREALKAEIRKAARSAYRNPGRTLEEVERNYLIDDALDKGIDGAIRRVRERNVEAAADFPHTMPLVEAQNEIFGAARRFFAEALQ